MEVSHACGCRPSGFGAAHGASRGPADVDQLQRDGRDNATTCQVPLQHVRADPQRPSVERVEARAPAQRLRGLSA
eukprot:15380971-Heterocapsa_arctica.AAC.1